MNKILSLSLAVMLMLSLTACEKREAVSEAPPPPSSSSEELKPSEPEKKPESSSSETSELKDNHLTEMYFDYFSQNSFVSVLFIDQGVEAGFADSASDISVGAYAISYLIANNPNYDFEKGSKLSDFDAVTEKFFGKKLTNYESDLVTLMPDNHIAATGWGFSPSDLVLKDIKDNADGTKTANFYMLAIPMEGPDLQARKKALLAGDFYGYNGIKEIELTFEEKVDDTRSTYLKFISAKHLGEAQKPYKVYGL